MTVEEAMKTDRTTYRSALGVALAAGFLLLLPFLAMQITEEVAWGAGDFAVAWILLAGAGITYMLARKKRSDIAYRAAAGVAVATALLLVWTNLAVGLIGNEGNPANLMVGGVLAVGIIGAFVARLRPHGMARAMFVTALAQATVAVIALIAGMQHARPSSVFEILGLNGFFVALFLGSALLFRHAARDG